MTTKNIRMAALCGAWLIAPALAHAQTAYVRPAYQFPQAPSIAGPASVQLGGTPVYMTPYLGAGVGHDDNLFLSDVNRKSSTIYVVSPGFKLDARDANKVLQLSFQNQIGRYASSSDDDYVDNTARGQFDMAIDHRNFLRVGYDYIQGHEPRGSTDRPFGNRPDRYRTLDPYATYAFGAPGAAGRLEAYYAEAQRHYLNNREFTTASDRDTREFGGAFYWRVMPRTYLMAEARQTDIDYAMPNSPSDARERRYYGGVTWEATAATTGTFKVGSLRREFTNDSHPTFNGSSWEGLVTWAPRTYSKFDFYTARQTNEATGLGSFILTSIAGVTWSHAWTTYFTTGVDVRYQKDDYQGFDRLDKTTSLGLRAGYRFRRWLTLGAEYTHFRRDSNVPFYEYDRNLYLLTATASM